MLNRILSEDKFINSHISHCGNKFLIGNGYLGIRGTMEEYTKKNMPAINMAGIYDCADTGWRESVNAPNPLLTYSIIDKKKYTLPEITPLYHKQKLDIKTAIHTRETVWNTEKGNITVICERFASMQNQHIIAMKYTLKTDFDCSAKIVTGIDGDVWDINGPHFVKTNIITNKDSEKIESTTGEKGTVVTTEEYVTYNFGGKTSIEYGEKSILKTIDFFAVANTEYTFEKISLIRTSSDTNPCNITAADLNYTNAKAAHIAAWDKIWNISEVEIDGDEEAEFALNYSIYHLNCIAPRNLKNISIPARGLSGQVYKGAVFWDTEMFMIDYYIHTEPDIAKTLIEYRIDTLDGARKKASQYELDGAYYAWESHEGGFDACSNYNIIDVFTKRPMRTYFRDKQYHVSAAIVYAIMKYINSSGDRKILSDGAMDVIIECARMYRSLLVKKVDGSFYEIRDVVGPDEYHERVNNNAYTNKMVQFVFKTACDMIKELDDNCYDSLDKKYNLKYLSEIFEDSYKNMYIPQPNEQNGLIEQFDGYFTLEDVSVSTLRSRLLHPKEYWGGAYGVASNTQVLKQADVVAMLSMFKNDYTTEIMQRNWSYYEPRTEHGSSLSACMYALLACHIGNPNSAYPLFMKSASEDLREGGKEWLGLIYIGGTHPASEGGAWIVAVKGFAGLEIKDKKPICNPNLPDKWKGMRFKVIVYGKLYTIEINGKEAKITEE